MAMRKVSVRGIARIGILVTAVLAMQVAPARAQSTGGGREINVSVLGGSTRFSRPMKSVDDLRAMAGANRTQITQVLTKVGLTDISTQELDTLTAGDVTETTIAPGTQLKWMALKRSGTVGVLQNVRWTGRQAFDAWQFTVKGRAMTYTFVVPKVCGNMSLLNAVATPVVTEA